MIEPASADRPWLMQEVIDWLTFVLTPESVVLETGAGGSTVFFARRAKMVLTYESDPGWANSVLQELLAQGIRNVDLRLDPTYPANGLRALTPAIDLAMIDGRGRVRSVIDVLPALKSRGWLVLDDSDRARYQWTHQLMDAQSTCKIVFRSGTDETTAWRKK